MDFLAEGLFKDFDVLIGTAVGLRNFRGIGYKIQIFLNLTDRRMLAA